MLNLKSLALFTVHFLIFFNFFNKYNAEAEKIGKLVVVAGNIMQFLIFCSSVFLFEGCEFAMTDRSLLYTVVKASRIL